MGTLEVEIVNIAVDQQLQPRIQGIDPEHVQELVAVPDQWPPLRVVKQGHGYLLVDGFHRLAAAQNLDLKRITVEVLDPPADGDLHALAFALNVAHGRPLTLSDRRAFAARLLHTHPEWADREVGRRCGLAQPTVAKVREGLERDAYIPVMDTRLGRDGNTYPSAQRRPPQEEATDSPHRPTSAGERNAQRVMVRYFDQLAERLEAQDALEGFETIDDAATACRVVLGAEKAAALAERLGWSSRNILELAQTLGFVSEARP